MMKKYFLIATIVMILLTINCDVVYAELPIVGSGEPVNEEGEGKPTVVRIEEGNDVYECSHNVSISSSYKIIIDSVDTKGTDILSSSGKITSAILSGTWIGINVTENSTVHWHVYTASESKAEYYKLEKKYTCHYMNSKADTSGCYGQTYKLWGQDATCPKPDCQIDNIMIGKRVIGVKCRDYVYGDPIKKDVSYTKPYKEQFSCPAIYTYGQYDLPLIGSEVEDIKTAIPTDSNAARKCYEKTDDKARQQAYGMISNTQNTVSFIDLNQYPTGDDTVVAAALRKALIKANTTTIGPTESNHTITVDHYHSPEKTCINVKTAEVNYNDNCKKSEENKMIKDAIFNGKKYWHYFIPLNTKTGARFYLEVEQKNNTTPKEICESIMSRYSNYINFIKPLSNTKAYIGDYTNKKRSSDDYKLLKYEGGCKTAIIIDYSVLQKFYNEKDTKIRGYGSYYRPIDINNPFPNGLTENSLWYGLIDTNKNVIKVANQSNATKTYNLADSFKEKTYTTYNINAKAIREYNHQERNFYTSWEDMKIDGTSTFVNTYITRNVNKNFYKLGCGPANSDWEGCKQ